MQYRQQAMVRVHGSETCEVYMATMSPCHPSRSGFTRSRPVDYTCTG